MPLFPVQVGTFTFTEDTKVTEYFECAAWHRTVVAKAGVEYPVVAHEKNPRTLYVYVTEKVSSACLVSRWGSTYGSDPGKNEIGKVHRIAHEINFLYGVPEGFVPNERITISEKMVTISTGPSKYTSAEVRGYELGELDFPVVDIRVTSYNEGSDDAFCSIRVVIDTSDLFFGPYSRLGKAWKHPFTFTGKDRRERAERFAKTIMEKGTVNLRHWRTGSQY